MKETIFLFCEECNGVFLTSNSLVEDKNLVCGQGCGGSLQKITKGEACRIFEEK